MSEYLLRKTLYFAAKTFFAITKFTSVDAFICNNPPIAVTNFAISACTAFSLMDYKHLMNQKEREREDTMENPNMKLKINEYGNRNLISVGISTSMN